MGSGRVENLEEGFLVHSTALQPEQLLGMMFAALAGVWVYGDALKRGWETRRAMWWGFGTFACLIFVLPLYLYDRVFPFLSPARPRATSACRYCNQPIEGDPAYCPHCAKQLKGTDAIFSRKQ